MQRIVFKEVDKPTPTNKERLEQWQQWFDFIGETEAYERPLSPPVDVADFVRHCQHA